MMDDEYKLDDIQQELTLFLQSNARHHPFIPKPLILKAQFTTLPSVSDLHKNVYQINMTQLASFRQHFSDTQYKYVRLHDWQFYIRFDGKKCLSIELNCQHIVLIASKTIKKQIKDCNFAIMAADKTDIKQIQQPQAGYLNRIGKRNLVTISQYVAQQHFALINFVKKPLSFNAVQKICMPIIQKPQQDALLYLNNRGKQILQKLKYFITRQDLLNFMVDQELSDEGQRQMRRIILADLLGSNKKKGGFQRRIVQALQKNLVD